MADITNLENFLTDVAGAIKQKTGKEEKIPAANFDTEILNIETGIDTSSDNPITPEDVVEGKEGFVNGEKITGTVQERTPSTVSALRVDSIKDLSQYNIVRANTSSYNTPVLFRANTPIEVEMNSTDLANAISLTPEKIVKGETIIGVEGIAEGGGALSPEEYEDCLTIAKSILGDETQEPYVPLNYIESTGIQYIDTGIVFENDTEVYGTFEFTNFDTDQTIFGIDTYDNQGGSASLSYEKSGNNIIMRLYWSNSIKTNDIEGIHTFVMKGTDYDGTMMIDSITGTGGGITAPRDIYLFRQNSNHSGSERYSHAKIYTIKIYKKGILVRDFIPAKDAITNKICMYDSVTKTFFYNNGDGEFVSGGVKK